MDDVFNFVILHDSLILLGISDVERLIGAAEINLVLANIGGKDATLRANLLDDGTSERDTNLAIGTSDEDLLAMLYSKIYKLEFNID